MELATNTHKRNLLKLNITRFFIILFLLAQYNFFLLIKFSRIEDGASIFSILITVILSILLFYNEHIKFQFYNIAVLISLVLMIIFSIIRSIYLFPLDVTLILKLYIQWFGILIYFPLSVYIYRDKEFFLKLFLIINLLFIAIISYQVFSYSKTSNLFLDKQYFFDALTRTEKLNFRNDTLRITSASILVTVSLLISATEFFKKNNQYFNLLNIICSFFYIYYVVQTRALTFLILIALIIYLFIKDYQNHSLKGYFIRLIIFLGIVFIIVITKSYNLILDTYNDVSDVNNQISSYARLGAVEYYKTVIINNPLFGNGIYIGDIGTASYYLARGAQGLFYYDDVGLIGNMAQFGFMSVVVLIIYSYTNIIKCNKIYYLIPAYILLSTLTTLSVINRIPIIALIISMAYMDASRNLERKISNE